MENYRPEILHTIKEAPPKGRARGPVVGILRDKRMKLGMNQANFNSEGFMQHHNLVKEFGITYLTISFEGIDYDVKEFDIDFRGVAGIENIEILNLSGNFKMSSDFDDRVLEPLRRVRVLISDSGTYGGRIPRCFPDLETWLNFSWSANSVKGDAGLPKLRNLHIDGLKGDLSPFARCDLRKLFLIRPSMKSLESVATFKNLELLKIESPRALLDVSALAALTKLASLDFGGKKPHTGWAKLSSKSIKVLRISAVESLKVLENFPNLEQYDLIKVVDDKNRRHMNFDVSEFDDPFTSILETRRINS